MATYFQTPSLGRHTGELGGGGMANLGVNLTHLGRGREAEELLPSVGLRARVGAFLDC